MPPGPSWFVVETKARCEALALENLENQNFTVLYPTQIRRRLVRRQVVELASPYFPGYLFVKFDPVVDRWQSINGTRGVKRLMCFSPERPAAIPGPIADILVEQYGRGPIKDAKADMDHLVGKLLRITAGPLEGLTGNCQWSDAQRVGLLIWYFGGRNIVTLDAAQVIDA